jgi:hypothetical protein
VSCSAGEVCAEGECHHPDDGVVYQLDIQVWDGDLCTDTAFATWFEFPSGDASGDAATEPTDADCYSFGPLSWQDDLPYEFLVTHELRATPQHDLSFDVTRRTNPPSGGAAEHYTTISWEQHTPDEARLPTAEELALGSAPLESDVGFFQFRFTPVRLSGE